MAERSNLITFDQMEPERHIELSAKGGRASGEAKRKKAEMRRRMVELMMQLEVAEELRQDFDEAMKLIYTKRRLREAKARANHGKSKKK